MRTVYRCEVCGTDFDNKKECLEHERNCNNPNVFLCQKCGKTTAWNIYEDCFLLKSNQCHTIDMGTLGYGSKLDGLHIVFDLCDNCLYSFIESFRYKNDVIGGR